MSRIITTASIQSCTLDQLLALHRLVHRELAAADAGSAARRNALASLETLERAITAQRALSQHRPPSP